MLCFKAVVKLRNSTMNVYNDIFNDHGNNEISNEVFQARHLYPKIGKNHLNTVSLIRKGLGSAIFQLLHTLYLRVGLCLD